MGNVYKWWGGERWEQTPFFLFHFFDIPESGSFGAGALGLRPLKIYTVSKYLIV